MSARWAVLFALLAVHRRGIRHAGTHGVGEDEPHDSSTVRLKIGGSRSDWSLTVQGDAVFTRYLDALFVTRRTALFGAVGLEAELQ